MKKILLTALLATMTACAQGNYHLTVDNNLGRYHGQSIYFRSNMRSNYAGQIRRVLSNKFAQIGMKTATSAESADFIAIFDIETFYRQDGSYKNTSYANTIGDTPLFTSEEDSQSLAYTGNANITVNRTKTCFTVNIGRRDTSNVLYNSSFCAYGVIDAEDMLPMITNVYEQYANYTATDISLQCLSDENNQVSCQAVRDPKQAFINSLWIENQILDDVN